MKKKATIQYDTEEKKRKERYYLYKTHCNTIIEVGRYIIIYVYSLVQRKKEKGKRLCGVLDNFF